MANADDFDHFAAYAIEDSARVPNKRGGTKAGPLHGQRRAFWPLAQARNDRERWEIGLEIVENVIEVF
jgi:hypothetical protein